MKEMLFSPVEVPSSYEPLSELARALGGEVVGKHWIHAPSKGCEPDDRSLIIRIDPARPQQCFIYHCEGDWRRARDYVLEKVEPVPPGRFGFSRRNTEVALRIWRESVAAVGTDVEGYLHSRGITIPPPPTLRFHGGLKHPSGGRWPAMVALVTSGVDDRPVGIHRTFLSKRRKAPVDPQKMMLGACSGGAVRLLQGSGPLCVGEGIETCLSMLLATDAPTWAALSTTGLMQLDVADVQEITILADADIPGEHAAQAAKRRWISEGRRVRIARPPRGYADFNDVLTCAGGPDE
jgi:hypothetical protein